MLSMSVQGIYILLGIYLMIISIVFIFAWVFVHVRYEIKMTTNTLIKFILVLVAFEALVVVNTIIYANDVRDDVKSSFNSSQELVCSQRGKKFLVSIDNNYTLKAEYFIRGEELVAVDSCKVLVGE